MKENKIQQVFLKESIADKLRPKISSLILDNCNILEIGIGTGMFTKTYQKPNQSIFAFEVDQSLNLLVPSDNIATFYEGFNIERINNISFEYLISAPPYFLLKEISSFVNKRKLKYVLMVGERYIDLFDNCKTIEVLESYDFSVNTDSKHYIITNI